MELREKLTAQGVKSILKKRVTINELQQSKSCSSSSSTAASSPPSSNGYNGHSLPPLDESPAEGTFESDYRPENGSRLVKNTHNLTNGTSNRTGGSVGSKGLVTGSAKDLIMTRPLRKPVSNAAKKRVQFRSRSDDTLIVEHIVHESIKEEDEEESLASSITTNSSSSTGSNGAQQEPLYDDIQLTESTRHLASQANGPVSGSKNLKGDDDGQEEQQQSRSNQSIQAKSKPSSSGTNSNNNNNNQRQSIDSKGHVAEFREFDPIEQGKCILA